MTLGVQGMSENKVPVEGWEVKLVGNKLLTRLVKQIPYTDTIELCEQSIKVPGQQNKPHQECHAVVVALSHTMDQRWQGIFQVGDRVLFKGTTSIVRCNRVSYHILDVNSVEAILRHEDYRHFNELKQELLVPREDQL